MDPTLPEAVPHTAGSQESMPTVSGGNPGTAETAPNTAPEQAQEVARVTTPQPIPAAPDPAPVTPSVTPSASQPQPTTQPVADDPLIADDVDVIEKEWVDKAKRIVNSTKDDPYTQEKEVSKLQADYLMKRYNKQVKLPE